MKLSAAFSLLLTAAAVNIASGDPFVNVLWDSTFVENVMRAHFLSGDLKDTFEPKVQLFFDGVQKMCPQDKIQTRYYVPNWDKYTTEPGKELQKNADKSWGDFMRLFSKCKLTTSGTVAAMIPLELFEPAMVNKETLEARVGKVIEFFLKDTVKTNDKVNDWTNKRCVKGALMEDIKANGIVPGKTPEDAAIKIAKRLVDLMLKLGENSSGNPALH